jgi:hypothetical protein
MKIGSLGLLGGLSLADVLRLRANTQSASRAHKAVIMIILEGGPSHIDMYDMKPEAPAEYRGEFKPIQTSVSGFDVCEFLPLHAKIADKLALVRSMQFQNAGHSNIEQATGLGDGGNPQRPVFGSVVSRLRGEGDNTSAMPPYVHIREHGRSVSDPADPTYLGSAHRPFILEGLEEVQAANLAPAKGITLDRLEDRQKLLRSLDSIRRDLDARGEMSGIDIFTARALNMISSPKTREAFDIAREDPKVRDRYGRGSRLLLARRLVEAGVSVVTVGLSGSLGYGLWDTHGNNANSQTETNFGVLRRLLPLYDQAIHALVTDMHDRSLDQDVCVAIWGEFGRTPKINQFAGRDHWPSAGFTLFAGGGLQMGQVIGETDARGDRARTRPVKSSHVLATLYHVLGIDPATTVPDFSGRPMYVLDDREKISELI